MKEQLGQLFALLDADFHAENHPCGWAFPCDGLHTDTRTDSHRTRAAACPSSFSAGGRLQLLVGGTWSPCSYGSARLNICTAIKPLSEYPGQKTLQK